MKEQQQYQTSYLYKISNYSVISKNDMLYVLVSIHFMKLVYKIYEHFKWCPLYCMKI